MTKSIISFVAVLLIILLLGYIALYGLDLGFYEFSKISDEENGIRRGLDLVGGSTITFEAQVEGDISAEELAKNMNVVKQILTQRLTYLGYSESLIYLVGDRRITVEIPSIQDPEEAVQKLGSTAQLEFKDYDGNIVMVGSDIKKATAAFGPIDSTNISQNYVEIELKTEAIKKFAEATKAAAQRAAEGENIIYISLDGNNVSTPSVGAEFAETGINSEKIQIIGSFTAESAGWLANIISSGQLPFSLREIEMRSVGPVLGDRALETSLLAGMIGIILVCIFMIVIYRLPGLVADFALLFYITLVLVLLSAFKVNLSLPGIAGIILSIGMAVDANVVIFERIREELRNGKTIKSAISAGFNRAFTAVLDSNVTTFIAALVLYIFGTGQIVGFAITLGIGIIVSMFTAVTVTHFLLNRLVDFKITNTKLYGI